MYSAYQNELHVIIPGDGRRRAAGEAGDDRVPAEVDLDVGPSGPRVHPARRRRVERRSGQATEQQLRRRYDGGACKKLDLLELVK